MTEPVGFLLSVLWKPLKFMAEKHDKNVKLKFTQS